MTSGFVGGTVKRFEEHVYFFLLDTVTDEVETLPDEWSFRAAFYEATGEAPDDLISAWRLVRR
ncbi:MAG: hypothetical protein AAFX05_01860 [Planctomycetota bacterium]